MRFSLAMSTSVPFSAINKGAGIVDPLAIGQQWIHWPTLLDNEACLFKTKVWKNKTALIVY